MTTPQTTVRSGAVTFQVSTSGAGDPLVLVHAGIADSRMWHPLVPLLSDSYRVHGYDLRGYGATPLPPEPFRHVEDLAAVVRAVADGPVHLVGASLGGRVAIELALEQPELVRSLVLLGTVVGGFEPDVAPPPLWDAMVAASRADDLDALADLEARTWMADPDGTRLPAGMLDLVREMNRVALTNERSGVAEETEPEVASAERLDGLRVPVLAVVGELDQPDIHLAAELVADRAPGAVRVVLPRVAHLPALERPDEVAALVTGFLSARPRA